MALLLEPFAYGYMLNAMWVSALVGGVCAFLSAYLMLKGWSLIGDASPIPSFPVLLAPICSACPFSSARSFQVDWLLPQCCFLISEPNSKKMQSLA